MRFSYSALWDDTIAMLRAHSALLMAVAGVFLFLPALLIGHFIPQPDVAPDRMADAMGAYLAANWGWLLLANLVNMVGAITIFQLVLDPGAGTVGASIARAIAILPTYFAAALLSGLAIAAVLMLLLIPLALLLGLTAAPTGPATGLAVLLLCIPAAYMFGRLLLVAPVVVAEHRRAPLRAVRRSVVLTRRRGWAVLGIVLLVLLAGGLVDFAVTRVAGALALLALGEGLGRLLVLILSSVTAALLSMVLIILFAAIYRRLTAPAASSNGI